MLYRQYRYFLAFSFTPAAAQYIPARRSNRFPPARAGNRDFKNS